MEWVLPPFDRDTVKRWHEDGCPALGGKPLPIKRHYYRPGNRRARATYIQAAHQKIILDSRGIKDPTTPRDPKRLNFAEAENKFGFSSKFLNRWSKRWHPKEGKPHVSLGVWIDCDERPSLSDRTSKMERWFWTDHLQSLYDNLKAARAPKKTLDTAKLLTITLAEIADLGVPLGTASNWATYCVYLSDRKGRLEPVSVPRLDSMGRVVPNAVEFSREEATLAATRYVEGKKGIWHDDDGNRWLLQRLAVKRAKLNPSDHATLGRLVKAGIIERRRAPMWAFGSKHGNTPWVYRQNDLDDAACGNRSRKVSPGGGRLRSDRPPVGLGNEVVRRLLKAADDAASANHHVKAGRRENRAGRRENRRHVLAIKTRVEGVHGDVKALQNGGRTKSKSLPEPQCTDAELAAILQSLGVSLTDRKPHNWHAFVKAHITHEMLRQAKDALDVQKNAKGENQYLVALVVKKWSSRFIPPVKAVIHTLHTPVL
jgi:hypothetical protein